MFHLFQQINHAEAGASDSFVPPVRTPEARFIKHAGNVNRVVHMDYSVNLTVQNMLVASKDTLVMRDRAQSLETFTPVYK
ncbi:MAG: hypothetical protein INR73_20680 [Williamsia sp.]|nr:hypothetical protein [Williamsia sp.]